MGPIAQAIYQVLRMRTPKPVPRKALIAFAELVSEASRYEGVPDDLDHHGDPRVDEAIVEIIEACREEKLPQIASLILNPTAYGPLALYSKTAHPTATTPESQTAAWEKELKEVVITFYPNELGTVDAE